jgi:predicted nucleic acid-binding Zn ribbon protein
VSFAIGVIERDLTPDTVLGRAQLAWRTAVGDAIAAQAVPTSERGGMLTVSCATSVWAQELDLMSGTIVDRLNEQLGEAAITRLRCVATPPRDAL